MNQYDALRVAQDRETAVHTVGRRLYAYRYAYARAAETRSFGQPGQDYITLREDERTLVFAVCDGVGQSFFGDLGARILGEALVEWLWSDVARGLDSRGIRLGLAKHLVDWTAQATELVQQQPLPAEIPAMQREVLEQKRALGSQSTFVCGRIDAPGEAFTQGRIVLAWMGDTRARIWGPDGERTKELGNSFHAEQRWSSSRGPLGGDPHVFVAPLNGDAQSLTRLVIYTDGLAVLDRLGESLSNAKLQGLIVESGAAATSDDVSFLEVSLDPAPAWLEITVLLPPSVRVVLQDGRIAASWDRVPAATSYEVEVVDGGSRTWRIPVTSWSGSDSAPGEYRLRVRAWGNERTGPWSDWQRVVVPEPIALPPVETAWRSLLRRLLVPLGLLLFLLTVSVAVFLLVRRRTPSTNPTTAAAASGPVDCQVCVKNQSGAEVMGATILLRMAGVEETIVLGQTGHDGCIRRSLVTSAQTVTVVAKCGPHHYETSAVVSEDKRQLKAEFSGIQCR